jgi:diacylglycerol O-acyltransferase 2, plant
MMTMHAPGATTPHAARSFAHRARTNAVLFLWLGLIHVNIFILACAAVAYPHPGAVAVVAALVTVAVLPRAPPFPRFGVALARSIARAACGYFPATLTFEDERAHLDAARDGQAFVVGLEPHGVLPLSIISFAAYYAHGDEEVYAMKGGFTPTMRSARALASAAIFNVPFVRHLWTWLGLDPISKRRMVDMLRAGRTVVMIPGGVAECMAMERGVETLYLRKRFGFIKVAIQTGAHLVPAFTFGQSEAYGYWRLGPPFVPKRVANWLSETFAFAPMVFWGKFCSPIPYATPLHTVVGKAIPVKQNDNPTNTEVAAKLEEFIDAMTTLFETHKAANGCSGARLRVV